MANVGVWQKTTTGLGAYITKEFMDNREQQRTGVGVLF